MPLKMGTFRDLFRSGIYRDLDKFCDVVVVAADGVEFQAHRLFLSKGSDYFLAFFRFNTGEKKEASSLEFDSDVLENILTFLYTGEVSIDDRNITKLITAADYLLIDTLLTPCKNFALRRINLDCCISLLVVSHFIERLGITKRCFSFVLVNFEELVDKYDSHIAELPFDLFKRLLSDNSLGVSREDTVWRAILLWVEGDENRLKNVPELVSCIRWSEVDSILASCIANHRIFKDNEFYRNLRSPESGQLLTGRCPRKMYLFMSRKCSLDDHQVEMFLICDGQLDIWRKIGERREKPYTLVAMGGFVYNLMSPAVGMQAFDLIKKRWQDKSYSETWRADYSAVQLKNKHLFVVGGWGDYIWKEDGSGTSEELPVEYYDPITDVWSNTSPLPPSTFFAESTVVNGKLYILGYKCGLKMIALVYDQVNDAWSNIGTSKQQRRGFAVVNFQERLFLIGGLIVNTFTTLVEVYDPEEDEWKEFPSLPVPYERARAVVLNDKLMVYEDSTGKSRFSFCTFNEATHLWEVGNGTFPFHEYQFCCIDDRRVLQKLAKENMNPETVWEETPFATSLKQIFKSMK